MSLLPPVRHTGMRGQRAILSAASGQMLSPDREKKMNIDSAEVRLLANALYEIRQLLSPYLGSGVDAPMEVRMAAHLAYALHNEALAITENRSFDIHAALRKVSAIDNILHVNEAARLVTAWAE